MSTPQDYINQCVANVESLAGSGGINAKNILSLCISAMQFAESVPNLSGQQKKDMVVGAINKLITDKGGMYDLLEIIPAFIDNCISIENGNIAIQVNPQTSTGCCVEFLQKLSSLCTAPKK